MPGRDHLHSRGENQNIELVPAIYTGSPPLTWRKRFDDNIAISLVGITSTHVEKTLRLCDRLHLFRDHLHSRGENIAKLDNYCSQMGSPPLTWRKRSAFAPGAHPDGITSTHVEKTQVSKSYIDRLRDHLHSRGENIPAKICTCTHKGSPPLTWRKPMKAEGKPAAAGITSTHVEKTTTVKKNKKHLEDHLHSRGENSIRPRQCG